VHNLESALIVPRNCCWWAFLESSKIKNAEMRIAFEVNFALWIMIGCGVAEYLS